MLAIACATCTKKLVGRQRRFCSRKCKNDDTNNRHQSYLAQGARGLERKLALLKKFGSKCLKCSYDRNSAALTWHHRDPKLKSFELDMRSLSNRSEAAIAAEAMKCDLLCANCHAETHFPHFAKAL